MEETTIFVETVTYSTVPVLSQNQMNVCGSEPHSSSAVWQYMLKIDASFGERKNGIRTQVLLNTGLSTEESKQVCI